MLYFKHIYSFGLALVVLAGLSVWADAQDDAKRELARRELARRELARRELARELPDDVKPLLDRDVPPELRKKLEAQISDDDKGALEHMSPEELQQVLRRQLESESAPAPKTPSVPAAPAKPQPKTGVAPKPAAQAQPITTHRASIFRYRVHGRDVFVDSIDKVPAEFRDKALATPARTEPVDGRVQHSSRFRAPLQTSVSGKTIPRPTAPASLHGDRQPNDTSFGSLASQSLGVPLVAGGVFALAVFMGWLIRRARSA